MVARTGVRFAQPLLCASSSAALRYALGVTSDPSSAIKRARIGLCVDCKHALLIESARGSEFYFCGLSVTDETFPKYPRLPVLECSGYAAKLGNEQLNSK
jgi:hypothetical protein